ncbi:MAG: hypothetical protein WAX04_11885 [Oscillospiraceae bacterium]
MNCPNCKKDIDDYSVFCNFCSFKVVEQQFHMRSDVLIDVPIKPKSKVFIIVIILSVLTALIIAGIVVLVTPHIKTEVQYAVAISEMTKNNYDNAHEIFVEMKKKSATYRDIEALDLFVQAKIAYALSDYEEDGYKIPLGFIEAIKDTYTGKFRSLIDEMKIILEQEKMLFEEKEKWIGEQEEEEEKWASFQLDLALCPLKIIVSHMSYDPEGTPQLSVTAQSTTSKTIDEFTVAFYCYDIFNKRVNDPEYNTNIFEGLEQVKVEPYGRYNGKELVWTAYSHESTAKYLAFVTEVHFTDDTTWEVTNGFDVKAQEMSDKCIENQVFE